MSKPQLEAFYRKLSEEKALKDKVTSLRGDVPTVYSQLVKIAKDSGYDVTVDDIKAAHSEKGELSDAELAKVAGGAGDSGCESVCDSVCGLFLGHWIGRQ